MKKLILCVLCVSVIVSFSACAASKNGETATAAQRTNRTTTIPSTESSTEPAEQNNSVSEKEITEKEAKEIAYNALKKEYPKGNTTMGVDYTQFEFRDMQRCDIRENFCAFNTGYSDETYNTSGHPYYAVSYNDNTQIAGFAYFCIDLRNGDVLFSGYMGD